MQKNNNLLNNNNEREALQRAMSTRLLSPFDSLAMQLGLNRGQPASGLQLPRDQTYIRPAGTPGGAPVQQQQPTQQPAQRQGLVLGSARPQVTQPQQQTTPQPLIWQGDPDHYSKYKYGQTSSAQPTGLVLGSARQQQQTPVAMPSGTKPLDPRSEYYTNMRLSSDDLRQRITEREERLELLNRSQGGKWGTREATQIREKIAETRRELDYYKTSLYQGAWNNIYGPVIERDERQHANREIADNWERWLYLAWVPELTDSEKREARAASRVLTGETRRMSNQIFLGSAEAGTQTLRNDYEMLLTALANRSANVASSFFTGGLQNIPFLKTISSSLDDKARELLAPYYSDDVMAVTENRSPFDDITGANPTAAVLGGVTSDIVQLIGVGKLVKGLGALNKIPWLDKALSSAITFGSVGFVKGFDEGIQEHGLSWEAALSGFISGGISAAGGFAGGAASHGTSKVMNNILSRLGEKEAALLSNRLFRAAINGVSGVGFAAGRTFVNELIGAFAYPDYEFDIGRIAIDLGVSFAFATVMSALGDRGIKAGGAARGDTETLNALADKYTPGWRKMSAQEANRVYRDLLKRYHPDTNKAPGADEIYKEINNVREHIMRVIVPDSQVTGTVTRTANHYRTATTSRGRTAQSARTGLNREVAVLNQYVKDGIITGEYVTDAIQVLNTVAAATTQQPTGLMLGGQNNVRPTQQTQQSTTGLTLTQQYQPSSLSLSNAALNNLQYRNSVDNRVLQLIDDVNTGGIQGHDPVRLTKATDEFVDVVFALTGNDHSNGTFILQENAISHINKRHGVNGRADQSMADPKDIARITWILENFDEAMLGDEKSYRFPNADNTPSDIILLRKKVNGYYYIAEAAPVKDSGEIYILSAYKNKNATGDSWLSPFDVTPVAGRLTAPAIPTVPQPISKVNEQMQETERRQRQFEIVQRTNPFDKTLSNHTWIRSVYDIMPLSEVTAEMLEGLTPDFTPDMAARVIESGLITVYSSKPIVNGNFVTPSKMEAQAYAGSNQVYSKQVNLHDVAWIDGLQGQLAIVQNDLNLQSNSGIINNNANTGGQANAKTQFKLGRQQERADTAFKNTGRNHSQDPGQQAQGLEKSTEGTQRGQAQFQQSIDIRSRIEGLQQSGRQIKQLTLKKLEIYDAGATSDALIVPLTEYTDEMKFLSQNLSERGLNTVYFVGDIIISADNNTVQIIESDTFVEAIIVQGRIIDYDIYLKADDPECTVTKIGKHEYYHHLTNIDKTLNRRTRRYIISNLSPDEYWNLFRVYEGLYAGKYKNDGFKGIDYVDAISGEIFADTFADIESHDGVDLSFYNTAVKTGIHSMRENAAAIDNKTGPPTYFSFAGIKAQGANHAALERAGQMEKDGTDTEAIRQQTGWFRGMDNKWRFEIDDSGMKYYRRGDIEAFNDPDYQRFMELREYESELFNKADRKTLEMWRDSDLRQEYEKLKENYNNHNIQKVQHGFDGGVKYLRDYIDHPELFKNYPRLRDTRVIFKDLNGNRGEYFEYENTIRIDNSLRNAPQTTLLHEIQHAIQGIENFTRGSSVAYWNNIDTAFTNYSGYLMTNTADMKIYTQLQEELLSKLPGNVKQKFIEYATKKSIIDSGSEELYAIDKKKSIHAELKQLYNELKNGEYAKEFNDYVWLINEWHNLFNSNKMRDAIDLNYHTAGEKEARDVANRYGHTPEGLLTIAPVQADSKTMFLNRSNLSESRQHSLDELKDPKVGVQTKKDILRDASHVERNIKSDLIQTFAIPDGYKANARGIIGDYIETLRRGAPKEADMQNTFSELYDAGRVRDPAADDFTRAAQWLRGKKLYVSPELKKEFGDDWNSLYRYAFGKGVQLTSNRGNLSVDSAYMEMANTFSGLFNDTMQHPGQMLEQMFDVLGKGNEYISLAEEARRYGGEEAVVALRDALYGDFLETTGRYYNFYHGANAARNTAIADQISMNSEIVRDYGRVVLSHIHWTENVARRERLRSMDKSEFEGTLVYGQGENTYPIKLTGSLADYTRGEQLREWSRSKKKTDRAVKDAEKRLRPTYDEKQFAHGMVGGHNTLDNLPASMRAEVVEELADYYAAEHSYANNPIAEQRRSLMDKYRELAEDQFGDLHEAKPKGAIRLRYESFEENINDLYRHNPERAAEINYNYTRPIHHNNAEETKFTNHLFKQVAKIEDGTGRMRSLTKLESAYAMIAREGQGAASIAARNPIARNINNAASNIAKAAGFRVNSKGILNTKDVKGLKLGGGTASEAYYKKLVGDEMRTFSVPNDMRDTVEAIARLKWVEQLIQDGKLDGTVINNAVQIFSEVYDELFNVIIEVSLATGYDIPGYIIGYAPHQQPESVHDFVQNIISLAGLTSDNKPVDTLPTEIAGHTGNYQPYRPWFSAMLTRHGTKTVYDLVGGFKDYARRASRVIFRTEDIMRVRAAERYIREAHSSEELYNNIQQAREVMTYTYDEKETFLRTNNMVSPESKLAPEDIDSRLKQYNDELTTKLENEGQGQWGNFVVYLHNYANLHAGKQSDTDRSQEVYGRKSLNLTRAMTQMQSRALFMFNASTALSSQLSQTGLLAAYHPIHMMKAVWDISGGRLSSSGDIRRWEQDSTFLAGRRGVDDISLSAFQKFEKAGFTPMRVMDYFMSSVIARTGYNDAISEGKTHEAAVEAGDQLARQMMGSRMSGEMSMGFQSKNFLEVMLTRFQYEFAKQCLFITKYAPNKYKQKVAQEAKEKGWSEATTNAKIGARIAKWLFTYALIAFIGNYLQEKTTGAKMIPLDIFGVLMNAFANGNGMSKQQMIDTFIDEGLEFLFDWRMFDTEGFDEDSLKMPWDEDFGSSAAGDTLWKDALSSAPFGRNIAGLIGVGDQNLPMPNIGGALRGFGNVLDDEGNITWGELGNATAGLLGEVAPGGRQLNRTYQGAETMLRQGHYRGYGDESRLQYPVETNPWNAVRAAFFGRRALPESQQHWASDQRGLTASQTASYESLVADGIDRNVAYNVFQDSRRINALKDLSGAEKDQRRRNMIRGLDMTDRQKFEVYRALYPQAESRHEKFNTLMNTGLSWNNVMRSYEKSLEINEDKSVPSSVRASAFAKWVDTQGFNPMQAAAIKEQFKTYIQIPSEATRYENFIDAGLTPDNSFKLVESFVGLEKDAERYRAIINSGLSHAQQMLAIGSIMGTDWLTESGNPTQWNLLNQMLNTGMSLRDIFSLREHGSAAAGNYLRYYDAGLNMDNARLAAEVLAGLDPEGDNRYVTMLQRQKALVEALADTDSQLLALSATMSDRQYAAALVANSVGIAPRQYVAALETLAGIVSAREGTSVRNNDVTLAVMQQQGLSPAQRAALWQTLAPTTSSRSNPFSRGVGNAVILRQRATQAMLEQRKNEQESEQNNLPAHTSNSTNRPGLIWAGNRG